MSLCPCGSSLAYAACCEPFHLGLDWPVTAEQLMRSRYSAYCKIQLSYLLESALPAQRPLLDQQAILRWAQESEWMGLEIEQCEAGTQYDDIGYVQFKARFKRDGNIQEHQERSCFRKVDGRWYYDDGQAMPVETFKRKEGKIGRNEPCPCGSGKKYKKCCGA